MLRRLVMPARVFTTSFVVKNACGMPISLQKYYKTSTSITNRVSYTTYKRKIKKNRNDASHDVPKEKIIRLMNFRSAEDAEPFYNLPMKILMHIHIVTQNDEKNGFCKNRLYYLSSRINASFMFYDYDILFLVQCPPSVLSEKIIHRIFIYSLSFDWLQSSLDILLEMGVSGDRILRDLWVLKYHRNTIEERLQKVKDMGVGNLYPWMVRCSEDILNRYINIFQETKSILGEVKSTQVYLANRLNIKPNDIEEMCAKVPALKTIRVKKVKCFLDFLIEQGFNVEDIAAKPRILCASQKTVEQRLDQLRKLGLNEINLNVLCRSKKDFNKYVESIESVSDESNNT